MFHLKNVPKKERILRLLIGVAALVFVDMNWDSSMLAVAAGSIGAILAMTGLVGFCPMCALLGRTLDNKR